MSPIDRNGGGGEGRRGKGRGDGGGRGGTTHTFAAVLFCFVVGVFFGVRFMV